MQNTRLSPFSWAFALVLLSPTLLANTPAHPAQARRENTTQAAPRLSFFQKIALKTAERKLRKALGKRSTTAVRGDSTRPCGYVVLHPGERVEAELLEISTNEITYRPCGQPNTAPITRNKREVIAVVAPNGDELFSGIYAIGPTGQMGQEGQKTDGLAIASFILGLLPFTIFGPLLAIIFGAVSLGRINRYPERYRGKGFAVAGIILGLLVAVLLLVALGGI